MNSEISWNIIHKYFENNKQILVVLHINFKFIMPMDKIN